MELRKKADYYKWKCERTSFNLHQALPTSPNERETTPTVSSSSTTQDAPSVVSTSSTDIPPPLHSHPVTKPPKPVPSRVRAAPRGADPRSSGLVIEDIEDSEESAESATQYMRPDGGRHGNVWGLPRDASFAPPADVRCTCSGAGKTPPQPEEVKGRVPTPILRESSAPARHHLDLTTPSNQGILIPVTKHVPSPLPYPAVSPKFRRDMRSTAPVNPLSKEDVDLLIQQSAGEDREVVEDEDPSVPKHISASSSPYHANCVPKEIDRDSKQRSTSHVRKLNFDKQHSRASQPSRQAHSAPFCRPHPSSCDTCGASLQPTAPLTSVSPPRAGKPRAATQAGIPNQPRQVDRVTSAKEKLLPAKTSSHTHSRSPSPKPRSIVTATYKPKEYRSTRFGGPSQPDEEPLPYRPYSSGNYGAASPTGLPYQPGSRSGGVRSRSPSPGARNTHYYSQQPLEPGSPHMPAGYAAASLPVPSYGERQRKMDEVSISSMSSCSVASGVLEKARRRRDHFWTAQHVPNE